MRNTRIFIVKSSKITYSGIRRSQGTNVCHYQRQESRYEARVTEHFIGYHFFRSLPRQRKNLVRPLDNRRGHGESALSRLHLRHRFVRVLPVGILRIRVVQNVRYLASGLRGACNGDAARLTH